MLQKPGEKPGVYYTTRRNQWAQPLSTKKRMQRRRHKYINYLCKKYNLTYEQLFERRKEFLSTNLTTELCFLIREQQKQQEEKENVQTS